MSGVPPERGEISQTESKSDLSDEDIKLLALATTEVERYRTMDRLVPSPHNAVTVAAIEVRQ